MPEKEFELYLSLLVKLLRLSPDQKISIERELRDHFEERFEALVRKGMPRDEAIRRTLEEFGDVAGLANEFTSLSRKHIRRRIMQGTMATAGVAAAIVIWATLFRGPDPAVGPGPNVVAQDEGHVEPDAERNAEVAVAAAPSISEGDVEWIDPGRFLSETLASPTELQFTGTPLREVISYIEDVHNLNILLDTATLSLEGITGEEEVTINMQQIPLHAVLDTILRSVNDVPLAWIQESEVLLITTKDRADGTETTQYYNARDLLADGYTPDSLISMVMTMTEGPWESIDGIGGTIAAFGDLLVAKQSQKTQTDIACTLAGLRSTHREARVVELEQHAPLYAVLDEPIQMQFLGTPLREVVDFIAEIHKVPIFLDAPVLSYAGTTGEEEITIDVNGIKLRSAFQLMLDSVNDVPLDVVIRDGAIWVTTKDAAMNHLGTVIYDVSDITENSDVQTEKLVEVIMGQTEGPWEDIDGTGGLIEVPTPARLACRQSRRAQDEVRAVLAAVRASLEASGGDRSSLTQVSTQAGNAILSDGCRSGTAHRRGVAQPDRARDVEVGPRQLIDAGYRTRSRADRDDPPACSGTHAAEGADRRVGRIQGQARETRSETSGNQ